MADDNITAAPAYDDTAAGPSEAFGARKEIAADPPVEGDGMALAGIITGAIGAVLMVVFLALGIGLGS